MKNKVKKIGVVLIIIFLVILNFVPRKNEVVLQKENLVESKKALSMMLETGAGTGVYETTTRSTWPTDGYLFNSKLSNCENGGKLSWDSETENVIMVSDKSDKCYVYFDVYNSVLISEVTLSSTSSSITVSVSATSGTSSISKYYYSKDNGLSYEESTESEYTFSNLTRGTNYKIKVYIKDSNEVSSRIVSKEIETKNSVLLADYIKSKYTTQGYNGLYLHNSSLANGAGDGSYRYAGSNPNNYVCFGTDVSPCPNDNLYRIIGVFGSQVKLIKADFANSNLLGTTGAYSTNTYSASSYSTYIGSLTTINRYYWTSSSNSSSVWSGSALNITNLNGTYLTKLGTTWTNKIADTSWKVGGNIYANIVYSPMNTAYQKEIVSPAATTTYNAKIGLIYVSDYGYAAIPTYWTYPGYSSSGATYDYRAAVSNNWMYSGVIEWTIIRHSDLSNSVFVVHSDGGLGYDIVSTDNAVRPCFYLNSSVQYLSGVGTSGDPIVIN